MREINTYEEIEIFCKALGAPARLEILRMLDEGEMNLQEIAAALNVTAGAVTAHIRQLEQAGLIQVENRSGIKGMQKVCSVPTRIKKGNRINYGSRVARVIVLTVLMVLVIFPFVWLVLSSFKAEKDILNYPPTMFADSYTLFQYNKVMNAIPIWRYVKNTLIFAGIVALVSVFLDSMAGYAFARINFKGRETLFNIIMLTMMIPFQIIMIPLFIEVFKMGMLNTYAGLILPRLATAFGIFMMRSFFVSLPKDLEEAARIDGLYEFMIFLRIMLPLCLPGMLTLGLMHLMGNWNDLLYPLMLTTTTEMRTLPAGLALFAGERVTEYGPIMAATVISMTPLLILYIFAQRYFMQGVVMSGMKD